jgi:hypothetical protein
MIFPLGTARNIVCLADDIWFWSSHKCVIIWFILIISLIEAKLVSIMWHSWRVRHFSVLFWCFNTWNNPYAPIMPIWLWKSHKCSNVVFTFNISDKWLAVVGDIPLHNWSSVHFLLVRNSLASSSTSLSVNGWCNDQEVCPHILLYNHECSYCHGLIRVHSLHYYVWNPFQYSTRNNKLLNTESYTKRIWLTHGKWYFISLLHFFYLQR